MRWESSAWGVRINVRFVLLEQATVLQPLHVRPASQEASSSETLVFSVRRESTPHLEPWLALNVLGRGNILPREARPPALQLQLVSGQFPRLIAQVLLLVHQESIRLEQRQAVLHVLLANTASTTQKRAQ